MRMKHLIPLLMLGLFLTLPAHGQSHVEVDLSWGEEANVPQAGSSYVTVTVTNVQDQPLTLMFVGVRFDWMSENAYLYGDGSEIERALEPDGSASYRIYFNVPENAPPGFHSAFLSLVYTVEEDGGATEYHQVVEVKPGVNVVAVVTLTETEVVVVTVSEQGGAAAPSRWPIALAALLGLIALIVVIVAAYRKRRIRG